MKEVNFLCAFPEGLIPTDGYEFEAFGCPWVVHQTAFDDRWSVSHRDYGFRVPCEKGDDIETAVGRAMVFLMSKTKEQMESAFKKAARNRPARVLI